MTKHKDRDSDLDQMLESLKKSAPSELQMQQWKYAVNQEAHRTNSFAKHFQIFGNARNKKYAQLFAAMLVGFIVGGLTVRQMNHEPVSNSFVAIISNDDATFEQSHVNLD